MLNARERGAHAAACGSSLRCWSWSSYVTGVSIPSEEWRRSWLYSSIQVATRR
jgi:hypothetical protein